MQTPQRNDRQSQIYRPLRRSTRRKFSLKRLKSADGMSILLRSALIATVGAFLLGMIVFAWFSRDLPSPGEIKDRTGKSTVFYDRNDAVLFEMFEDKNRVPVKMKDIPDSLKQATIAVEDKDFYSHGGFSLWGIFRSVVRSALTGRRLAGGSTLTQQLVKNVLLSQERSVTRKIKEVILSVEIERRYTKDEILEMYLNESPYGGTFWGVQSASKGYFGKDAHDLTLVVAALMAGLPQSPTRYSPLIGDKDAYKGRTKDVLRRMREDDYITKEQELKALKDLEKVTFKQNSLSIDAPHFVFYVRKQIVALFGEKILDQGIQVKTTLDAKMQEKAQGIVHDEVEKLKAFKATNGAAVAMDSQTGDILAMVGSYDFTNKAFGQHNVATSLRQPGSSIKPFTYATAFKQGYSPASIIMDVPTEFPNQGGKSYTPNNYDGKFRGPVTYRRALANSLNIPAVKILAQVGVRNMMQTAFDMGVKSLEPTQAHINKVGLSVTLGGGETTLLDLTNGFSTFARSGEAVEPVSILEIRDRNNKVIYKAKRAKPKRAISEEVAFLISHILSDNNARSEAFGTRSYLQIPGKTVAVKTGTTNNLRDNWTVGYTQSVTVGTWVGNNNNSPMNSKIASGVTGASPIWNGIMRAFLNDPAYKDGIMPVPENVEAIQVDALLGGLPKDGNLTRSDYFIKQYLPKDVSPFYKKIKLSKSDPNKRANDVEIKAGEYDEKEYIVITEDDPISTDGTNRWQAGIDAWVAGQDDSRYKVPGDVSSSKGDDVVIDIKEPSDHSTVGTNDVRIRAKVTSLQDIQTVRIQLNGATVKEWHENKKDIDEIIKMADGTYELKIFAQNSKGNTTERSIKIGVNRAWDADAVTQAPTAVPTTVTPSVTVTVTP